MKKEYLDKVSLVISILPLTLFIIRRLKIGMEPPLLYIIFAVYGLLIIVGFVWAICLVKDKKSRTSYSKAALVLSSLYVTFFSLFIYLTVAANF